MARHFISIARNLRQHATPAEAELWKCLRARRFDGLKFRRQHPRGNYIHDFFCAEALLVIELDGSQHESSLPHYVRDIARDEALAAEGFTVLRFSNHEVLENISAVLAAIRAAVATNKSPLSLQGEGVGGEVAE